MTSVALLSTLQQVQANLAAMFPNGATASGSSDTATLDSFHQVLAMLSPGTASTAALSASPVTPAPVTGAQVVADAKKYLGVPYVLGGTSTSGIDCSALVQKTYGDLGITLPRLVHQQKLMGTAVPSLAQAQPGDLIVFKGGGHIAIYEGNGRVMHAPYPGRVVSDQKLWVGDSGIETIRRIVPSAGTADAAAATTASASSTSAAASSTTASTTAGTTSAAVQAAALATVQAIMQADFGLLSSATTPTTTTAMSGLSGLSANSSSSTLQAAITAMAAGTSPDATTTGLTTGSTSTSAATLAAQQTLATLQSMIVQGRG